MPAPTSIGMGGQADAAAYAIQIEGMRKSYGRTQALRGLSMHVPRGSIYGFVGPNGAGKSTTMRALATLERSDEGTALVDGIDTRADPAAIRNRIGYMPDFAGVYESLTVNEYLDFYGASHQIRERRRRQLIDELVELMDLGENVDTPVGRLSRGMKQRLVLARCLIHDPTVLLLDEPAAGLDPQSRLDFRDILRELSRLHKTVLISSQILLELAEICTHIGVIRNGALVLEGALGDMLNTRDSTTGAALRLRLRDTANRDSAARLLRDDPSCLQIEDDSGVSLHVQYAGSESDVSELLSRLVAAGIRIVEFALERPTIEDFFLQVTERSDETA